jgi:hypothetical protein
MERFRKGVISMLLSVMAMVVYLIPMNVTLAFSAGDEGQGATATTTIKHKPIKYFVEGKRIRLDSTVKDDAGVQLVRCYFKGKEEADYLFVPMNQGDKDEYSAILPAPGQGASAIQYLFLVVNKANQVVKSQSFSIKKGDAGAETPSSQITPAEGNIKVSTELSQAPSSVEGFSDSITVDVVESTMRFGFVAGLYSATQMAAAGGVTGGGAATAGSGAATATSAGAVTAGAGLSTAAVVGIGAGVAVVGAGAAAAGGGGGGGNSSPSPNPSPSPSPNPSPCASSAGSWSGSYSGRTCYGYSESGSWSASIGTNCSCRLCADYSGCGTCTATGNGLNASMSGMSCGTVNASGTISGNSISGSYSFSSGGGGSWRGSR